MDDIHIIAKEYDLIVIEDGAHALGSVYKGKKVGTMSDMTTFSFHPVKPITTGDDGMIVTDNEEFYKKMMVFRSHGITRDENLMTRNDGSWFYQQLDLGYKDVHCRNAERIYSHIISLPLYPTLTMEEQDYVIQQVCECTKNE